MGLTGPAMRQCQQAPGRDGRPEGLIIAVTAVLVAFLIAVGAAPIAIGIGIGIGIAAAMARQLPLLTGRATRV